MSKPDHKQRMKEIKKKIKIIDDRYKNFLEEIKLPLVQNNGESQLQPATFEKMFFNNVCEFILEAILHYLDLEKV